MGTEIKSCIIIGAGDINNFGAVAGRIKPGCFVVCADGGLTHCRLLGVTPDLLVGDFDSLRESLPAGVERVTLSAEKNYTDSWHAAEEMLARGFSRFLLTGMTGGRLDHTLANLGLLAYLAGQGADALMTDGVLEAQALTGGGALRLPSREGYYFSLVALSDCTGVTIRGGKFPLEDYPLTVLDPRAVSNEFTGSPVTISQKSGALAVLSMPVNG